MLSPVEVIGLGGSLSLARCMQLATSHALSTKNQQDTQCVYYCQTPGNHAPSVVWMLTTANSFGASMKHADVLGIRSKERCGRMCFRIDSRFQGAGAQQARACMLSHVGAWRQSVSDCESGNRGSTAVIAFCSGQAIGASPLLRQGVPERPGVVGKKLACEYFMRPERFPRCVLALGCRSCDRNRAGDSGMQGSAPMRQAGQTLSEQRGNVS